MDETRKLQCTLLLISEEIKRLCEKHAIPYFICCGTLLGAVRHRGFIPWDDDLDIGMKRADYERFLRVCETELGDRFLLQSEDSEERYAYGFCKVQLKNTSLLEDFSKDAPISHGIFVDIFPYDRLPDGALAKRLFLARNALLKKIIWVRCGYGTESQRKLWRNRILAFFSAPFSVRALKRHRKHLLTRYNGRNTTRYFVSDYPDEQPLCSWLDILTDYPFESTSYSGLENYDAYLSMLYGDYMELPPEEARKTHRDHPVDFGPYSD